MEQKTYTVVLEIEAGDEETLFERLKKIILDERTLSFEIKEN